MPVLLCAYALLLLYGSLYPFEWSEPLRPALAFLHDGWPGHLDKGDVVQNVLVYMPFGLLMVAWRHQQRQHRFAVALALAALCGTAISITVEVLQQYLPARVPSLVDVATNAAGSVAGALLGALVSRETAIGARLLHWRDAWFRPGALASTGLIVVGLWFLAQTSPLVPSLDIAQLRHALGFLYRSVTDPVHADLAKLATLLCYQGALAALLCALLQPGRPVLPPYCLLTVAVCAAKLLVVGRVLSLELIVAAALALPVAVLLRSLRPPAPAWIGSALLAAGLTLYELAPVGTPMWMAASGFNWVPFEGQMNGLNGFENILEFLWPTMAMAYLVRQAVPFYRQEASAVAGGILIALAVFALEWAQQTIPGRYGDITQVMLACAGWIVPWCVPGHTASRPGVAAAAARVR